MNPVLYAILLLTLFALAIFIIPSLLTRRAIRRVIKILRDNNATNTKKAKTIEALGLQPQSFIEKLYKSRDYKPNALRALMKHDVVCRTKDGKIYLSEEKLGILGLDKH